MRILHVTPSYKPAFQYGGPTISVSRLAEAQTEAGAEVSVYTTTANGADELSVSTGKPLDVDDVSVWYFRRWTGDHGHLSPHLLVKLWQTAPHFDVIHIHSWWNWVALGAALVCRLRKVQTVITPHGMLSPYTLKAHGRRFFQRHIGNRLLKGALLHATSQLEQRELKAIAPQISSDMVHNIVELPCMPDREQRKKDEPFRLLFISRVHPKKGLDVLLEALRGIETPWQLTVAGDGADQYVKELKARANQAGIGQQIHWIGWVSGPKKWQVIADSDLLILPSRNENFAIVVIEALALGVPVLVSDQVGLCDYILLQDFGWVCSRQISDLHRAIEESIKNENKRTWIRHLAPQQILIDFEPRRLAARYFNMYKDHQTAL
ncbi:MAG: glycosyltransferase [Saprospirales bacterium]|nr:glycosyltransferase [Saprospirales bacterium]